MQFFMGMAATVAEAAAEVLDDADGHGGGNSFHAADAGHN